ncbi:MAG: transporter substrate-binding domain-containing protein [bacterium]
MEIAKRKNLKINYAEEVTRATSIETLNADRVDMIASPVWATDVRIANATLSDPVYYSPIGAYARANDNRFDTIEKINDPTIRIAAVD